jgi:hypothetical protein
MCSWCSMCSVFVTTTQMPHGPQIETAPSSLEVQLVLNSGQLQLAHLVLLCRVRLSLQHRTTHCRIAAADRGLLLASILT